MKKIFTTLSMITLCMALISENSPNISRVIEYRPAPGQHINRLFPIPDMSDTPENALKFANEKLVNNAGMLGLGGFGGYVIVGFDHPIVNVKGEYDFKALGNAFENSAEPGIVMVCQDLNKNGKPDEDEPWYELAGSDYNHPETIKNYEVTYYRPEPDGQKSAIRWTDNQGNEGTIKHMGGQSTMYPLWISDNTLTFKGTKLRNTVYNDGIFRLPAFDWGYVDNHANSEDIEKNGFKIDWAVDDKGKSVDLAYIDFIKIHTAQLQEAGWMGETSTEVLGVIDLHPDAVLSSVNSTNYNEATIFVSQGMLRIKEMEVVSINLYNVQGTLVRQVQHTSSVNVNDLPKGVYIVETTDNMNSKYFNKITN